MLKKIRSLVSNSSPSYIECYDDALTKEECRILISLFEKGKKIPGYTYYNGERVVDSDIKKSIELDALNLYDGSSLSAIVYRALAPCINKYQEKYNNLNNISFWECDSVFTFQKYDGEDEGFKGWHTEHGMGTANRIAVWHFYLNDAESGTEFMSYPTINAKIGRCVIWPASWTHVHRSAPNKGLKYIISGWMSLKCQETL